VQHAYEPLQWCLSVFSKQVITPPTHPILMLVLSHPITTTSSVIFLSFVTSMIDVAISVALLDDGILWVRYSRPGSVRTIMFFTFLVTVPAVVDLDFHECLIFSPVKVD